VKWTAIKDGLPKLREGWEGLGDTYWPGYEPEDEALLVAELGEDGSYCVAFAVFDPEDGSFRPDDAPGLTPTHWATLKGPAGDVFGSARED
jgi:hypothetical protein